MLKNNNWREKDKKKCEFNKSRRMKKLDKNN